MSVISSHALDISLKIWVVFLKVEASAIISTLPWVKAKSFACNDDTLSAIPSTSSPASSNSTFAPRRRSDNVFNAVPTCSGFWITEFAAVIKPIDSSSVFPLSYNALAERCNASPIPVDEIAKLFPTSLNLSTIAIELSASMPNAFIVEIILSVAWETLSIPSPTFL